MLITTTVFPSTTASSLIPTTFTPLGSCSNTVPFVTALDTLQILFQDTVQVSRGIRTDCYPSGYNPTAYLSAAPFCPVGYTAACGSIAESVTSAICCPTGGWSCANTERFSLKPTSIDSGHYPCYRLFTQKDSFPTVVLPAGLATFTGPATLQAGASVDGFAYGVRILWQSTDLVAGATPALVSAQITKGAFPTSSASSSGGTTAMRDDAELMKLQIGLGIGIPLFCILIAAVIFSVWYRKRKTRHGVRGMVDYDEKTQESYDSRRKSQDSMSSTSHGFGFAIGRSRRSRERSSKRNEVSTGVIRPAPAYPTKTPKHTRFDRPASPGTLEYIQSKSDPTEQPEQAYRPSTSYVPPKISSSPINFSPLLPPRPSTVGSNGTGFTFSNVSQAFGSSTLTNHDLPARPQSPGYAIHTELWRQQQHQWILDERRQISAHYERLKLKQDMENEQMREMVRKERENHRSRKNSATMLKDYNKDFNP